MENDLISNYYFEIIQDKKRSRKTNTAKFICILTGILLLSLL